MRRRSWVVLGSWSSTFLLIVAGAARAGSPLSNDASPLAVCQDTVRTAAIRLNADAHRAISACLTRGIECLVGDAAARSSCCERAAERCTIDLGKLDDLRDRFTRYVSNRRCRTVPLDDVLGADGLGYETLVASCGPPEARAATDTLEDVADCIAGAAIAATACATGTAELPRGAEALACTGLTDAFHAATRADLGSCAHPSQPTASPTAPGATPSIAPTATPLAATATPLPTGTATPATTPTGTATPLAATPTATATPVPTVTRTATPTPLPSSTPTATAIAATATAATAPTATATVTAGATPTVAPTATVVATLTAIPTQTSLPTVTVTRTQTPVPTVTVTPTQTALPTVTVSPTPTRTATPPPTKTATPTRTPTPIPTPVCGNGVKETGEDCDDGNNLNCDSCPANCKTVTPTQCTSTTTRFTETIHLVPPSGALLSAGTFCIEYPPGVVALPGSGFVTGRVSGVNAVTSLNDFNNAAQLGLVATPGFTDVSATISFDLCSGQTAPTASSFTCTVKSASNQGDSIDPPTLVQCTPQ